MAKTNKKLQSAPIFTHGGARASRISHEQDLERAVLACMLWEDTFYASGSSVAKEIQTLVPLVAPEVVSLLAQTARKEYKLRHVPLFLVREMARHPEHRVLVAGTLENVIQRPDELGEFLALYWSEGRCPIAASVKKGLAAAFTKFDEYSLAKYNGEAKVTLRDVLFVTHAKPKDDAQAKLWKRLVEDKLKTPDTWEVELSAGKDKKETFTRLIREHKLHALALLRNLRNMVSSGVDEQLIKQALESMNSDRVLPFRFITSAIHAPRYESQLEAAMLRCLAMKDKLPGHTVLVVDVSGSMSRHVSSKSELSGFEAAAALAILAREICESVQIYVTAGNDGSRIHYTELVPARHGFALSDAILNSKARHTGGGIFLTQCMDYISGYEPTVDRVIVFTDEQDCDTGCNPETAKALGKTNYIVNVSSERYGIAYGKFNHITGFSEAILDYIRLFESL